MKPKVFQKEGSTITFPRDNFVLQKKWWILSLAFLVMVFFITQEDVSFAGNILNGEATNKAFEVLMSVLKEAGKVMAVGGAVMAAYSIVNMILSSQNGAQFGSQVYTLAGGIVLIIVGLALVPIARYFVN